MTSFENWSRSASDKPFEAGQEPLFTNNSLQDWQNFGGSQGVSPEALNQSMVANNMLPPVEIVNGGAGEPTSGSSPSSENSGGTPEGGAGSGGVVREHHHWHHGRHQRSQGDQSGMPSGAPQSNGTDTAGSNTGGDILVDKLLSDPSMLQALQSAAGQLSPQGMAGLEQSLTQSLTLNPYTTDSTLLQQAVTDMTQNEASASDLSAMQSVVGALGGSTAGNGDVGSSTSTGGDGSASTGATLTASTSSDPIIQQFAQSDPELAQILTDSQSQMSPQGYSQFEQLVAQNWATGQFPDDNSLLQQSLQQFQQQGGSATDLASVSNVVQNDLQQYGDSAVSTYQGTGSTGTGSDSSGTGTTPATGGDGSGSTGTGTTPATGGDGSGSTGSGTTPATGGDGSGSTGTGTTPATGGDGSGSTGTGTTPATGGDGSGSTGTGTGGGGGGSTGADNSGLPSSLAGQGYTQVFNSNFANGGLNQFVNGEYKFGVNTLAANDEDENYNASNATVQNGNLILYPTSQGSNGRYYSGVVSTNEAFTGGVFSMTAKLPGSGDTWPAFWMQDQNFSWPPEIDVMEALGNGQNNSGTDTTNQTYHIDFHPADNNSWGNFINPSQVSQILDQDHPGVSDPTLSNTQNTYTVDWVPGKSLTYYLDGQEVGQTTQDVPDQPMYMTANLAIGGTWGGHGDAPVTGVSGGMDISSITAYQTAGETNTGDST